MEHRIVFKSCTIIASTKYAELPLHRAFVSFFAVSMDESGNEANIGNSVNYVCLIGNTFPIILSGF